MGVLEKTDTDRSPVSLTGHYTGEVWVRNGLSPSAMSTRTGRNFYRALRPLDGAANRWLGISLETMLVQRHRLIDELVLGFVARHPGAQVLELACGVSDRARRLLDEMGDEVTYIETDLPDMVAHKLAVYQQQGWSGGARHQVAPCNILRERGEISLERVVGELDRERPLMVISEGLLNYFSRATVENFLLRLSALLSEFAENRYVTEIWPRLPHYPGVAARKTMIRLIETLTRQEVPLHFTDNEDIARGFRSAGFAWVRVINPDHYAFTSEVPAMGKPSMFRVVCSGVNECFDCDPETSAP